LAVALDYYFIHRPLAVYIAAVVAAVIVYSTNRKTSRLPLLLGLLAVEFLSIVSFQRPLRLVALVVTVAASFFSAVAVAMNPKSAFDEFFVQPAKHDHALDALLFLTIGGYAWARAHMFVFHYHVPYPGVSVIGKRRLWVLKIVP